MRSSLASAVSALSITAALGCVSAASGHRDALDAARVEWYRRVIPTQDGCTTRVRALSSYAFDGSCGRTVTYVRCTYSSGGTCCDTMDRDSASATSVVHLVTVHDTPTSRVCE